MIHSDTYMYLYIHTVYKYDVVSWLVRSFGIINSLAQIILKSQIVWGGRNETQFRPINFQIWKIEYY